MIRPSIRAMLGVTALVAGLAGQVQAQDVAEEPATAQAQAPRDSAEPVCAEESGKAEPATSPDASEDGTAAENTGTTGWSGGTGGSQLGTNTQGAVEKSPTWQPPTARGLDLKGQPEDSTAC